MHAMLPLLHCGASDFPRLRRAAVQTLQVNLGYRCNQSCLHCHVNAGPKRSEMMDAPTIEEVLRLLQRSKIERLDITGGAPELNPNFTGLVERAVALGVHVMDRCNLTILSEAGQEGLGEFLAKNKVEVIASLPCYLEENVDSQRGDGVFARSIQGLRLLNSLGYGVRGSGLTLNLVYNPTGPQLPPSQAGLESDYRRMLGERYGVAFDHLFTLTNMPISRFGSTLVSKNQFDGYMQLLRDACQPANFQHVMCRTLISVDWRGYLYDCDFNQMLGIPLGGAGQQHLHISQLECDQLVANPIAVADHCYGCTAGQGSSCGGALE